jgi:excisionase family DNA binding protein
MNARRIKPHGNAKLELQAQLAQLPTEGRYMDRHEIGLRLDLSQRTVDALVHKQGLPAIRVGSSLRFYWPEVIHWLKEHPVLEPVNPRKPPGPQVELKNPTGSSLK